MTNNVITDSPWGDPDRTVVVSAHNDSVVAGPGINDDGSGTAMDLELARHLGSAGQKPRNHVRFLWVGAEELGLLGSSYYVVAALRRRGGPDHRDARLRHGRLAELGAAGLRR